MEVVKQLGDELKTALSELSSTYANDHANDVSLFTARLMD